MSPLRARRIVTGLSLVGVGVFLSFGIKGLNKDELNNRFGYILAYDQATPYLQICYKEMGTVGELGVSPQGKEVLFLRDSAWMVIMDNNKAVDLVLCKGY